MNKKVSVLIPAYNEETTIGTTIKAITNIDFVSEIVVIDDGSKDDTFKQAKRAGASVLSLDTNQGKGAALNYGIQQVTGDIILFIDADLEDSAREAKKLLRPVLNEEADMTIAQFPPAEVKGGIGLVKGLATWGLKKITNQDFKTPLSGQRALTMDLVKKVRKFANGFGVEVALTIDACKLGFKVVEVPVNMTHRETKRNIRGFLHRGKQFKDVLKVLASKIRR
ncbi:glycosyl transferase [Halobacteroides halobius DSM 5150]|uniref:Glucosyl-3-phosphoglycerate synthase n=1 Tax=Halobacteroides halobius (strain ATCC 35273 / DSM 5150 / MD-1) TaxID=748449 RepID=L0K7L8_HALHC|nr:glycosyl transferase [Halobacteroides halobius DSM 5150]